MSSHIYRVLVAAVSVFFSSAVLAVDYGRTTGSFEVSSQGSATYTIPIWTPPGPNGVQPSLSLSYDSQGGNGLAGVGWNLNAVSSIERCNRTKHQDVSGAPIDLTVNDRFCIGGNRLRNVSGTYGAANSVYFTEVADYSRITAYGTAGNGPQYFVVEAKSGLKFEYGNTPSSRVVLGTTVLRWMLNKVYDRNGNNYVVSYNNGNGFAVPDVISWTPTYLGSPSYRYEAKFNYINTRTDDDSYQGSVAGNAILNRYRLENIQIKSAGTVVRKYLLGYGTSSATYRSRLTSVTECQDDGNCLMPLTFGYQAGQVGTVTTASSGGSTGSSLYAGKYDFNGDGRSDLLFVTGTTWKVAFSTGTGVGSAVDTGISSTATFLVQKFLANHQDGLLVNVSGTWNYVGYNGSSFVSTSTGIPVPTGYTSGGEPKATDNNGDGIADLVWALGGNVFLRLNTTTAGASVPSFGSAITAATFIVGMGNVAVIPAQDCPIDRKCDVNGDGRADLVANVVTVTGCGMSGCTTTNAQYDLIASGTGYGTGGLSGPIGYRGIRFNDDQCIDRLDKATGALRVSGCNGGTPASITPPATASLLLDWNGDGKTDLLVNSGGTYGVYLSKGNVAAPFSSLISTSVPVLAGCTPFVFDLDGDGFDDIGCVGTSSPYSISYYTHAGSGGTLLTQQPDLLNSITDGFGVGIAPSYASTSQSNYTRGTGTQLPLVDETDPIVVVAKVTSSNGIGGTFDKTYAYVGARRNWERDDFVGFLRVDETDSRNGLITRTYFDQLFPLAGMVSQKEVMQPSGVTPISRAVFVNTPTVIDPSANNQRHFAYTSSITQTEYEAGGTLNGALIRTITTANSYETTGGTLYDQTVTTTEPVSGANGVNPGGSWSARTYLPTANLLNDTANWCLGRPQHIEQINWSNQTYSASITRTKDISWNAAVCRPTQIVDESGNSTLQVTTGLGYDGFGNVNSTTISPISMTSRTTSTSYSDSISTTGQFPLTMTNALGQASAMAWDYDLGVPTSATDPNGIQTTWEYDLYGRRKRENRPDGTYTAWLVQACAGCDSRVRTQIFQIFYASGAPQSYNIAFLDQFDRSIYEYSRHFNGNYNVSTRDFDSLGRVLHEYFPYQSNGAQVGYATISYDLRDRPTAISRPISDSIATLQTTDIFYEGLKTSTRDAQLKYSYRILNAAGQVARSQDHDGYYQSFDFDSFGNLKRVQDSAGNTLQSSTYNLRGMLTQRFDMDMGTWNFTPDALGQTIAQTDAKGQGTSFGFDLLGRLTSRTEAEGTSSFVFGTSSAAKNIGRLASMSGPGYAESHSFDSLGRPSTTTISADTTYQIDYDYNVLGMLDTVTYPTSTSSYRLRVKYEYQDNLLYRVRECTNAPCTTFGTNYWTATSFNARNQVTQESLGNGLTTSRNLDAVTGWLKTIKTGVSGGAAVQDLAFEWDLVGNLKKRKDMNQSSLTEEFFYDNLYRLDYSTLNAVTNLDLGYDALGNITYKSDVGTYAYHASKKHQVTSTSNGWGFGYDDNGNMTSGRGATIGWTSYNYPNSVTSGSDTATFSYTPDRQYWKQVSNYTSGGSATTI